MNASILIVEDEKPVATGLSYMIQRSLPDVTIVGVGHDGADGLSKATLLKPDVIMTDINMPQMDGLEMIEKAQETGLDCGYIILSGYSEFDYAKRAMHLGVRHYLTKPVNEKEMIAAISQVIEDVLREREERAILLRARLDKKKTEAPASSQAPMSEQDTITSIKAYIQTHASEPLTLRELSQVFFLNASYISQLFKSKTGDSYINYLTSVRMRQAQTLLETTDLKVIDICERVGYNDCGHFTKTFEKEVGMRPNAYRMQLRTAGNH